MEIPGASKYAISWIPLSVIYVIVIIWIVKHKTENGKKKYTSNIILAMMVNVVLGSDLSVTASLDYDISYTIAALALVVCIFIIQVIINVESVLMREVEYRIKTKSRRTPYVVQRKPVKSGKYYYITQTSHTQNRDCTLKTLYYS